ncbi:MAG: SDR family NAD(P)-dependent oxidoreductase [Planctomycetota bacterium]|jgi:serine 3-dehydrogenase|nr:SDR family NAD(P)-dependent oxidoreductase [Planctomycetota bacterium]
MANPKRVLITGATAGIGRACVYAFHASGWEVWCCGRRQDRLESLQSELQERIHSFALDVRDHAAVEKALSEIPPPNLLVNNAGLSRGFEPLWEGNLDDWNEMLDTNVKGLLHVTRFLLPRMTENGGGQVINIGSIAGHEAYPNGAAYCASKHAVAAITRALRKEACGTGIKVSSVDPGLVNTEFSTVRFHGDTDRADRTYDGMTPLSAEDVAETVLWVATRPDHVNPAEILLLPTDQASAGIVHRQDSE